MAQLAVLIIGNGRLDYLHQAVDTLTEQIGWPPDHWLMIDDSGCPAVHRELDRVYPDFQIRHHPQNLGMARAIQTGFDLVLSTNATHVLWWEEDFIAVQRIPVLEAIQILDQHPDIAQVLYQRQPLTPTEEAGGSVIAGFGTVQDHGEYVTHQTIFSLNPSVIPRAVLHADWPAGNEAEMTRRLNLTGWRYACWKQGPLVTHIGTTRGKQWQL